MPRKLVGLTPQRRLDRCVARLPARRQIFEIRQRRAEAGLVQHREPPRGRPQHEAGAAIGALEGRAFVARRLVKMLLVRHQILESVGRAQLVLGEWKIVEPRLAAIRTPPLRQDQRPVNDLGNLEFFVLLLCRDSSGDGRNSRYVRRCRSPRSTRERGGDRNPPLRLL